MPLPVCEFSRNLAFSLVRRSTVRRVHIREQGRHFQIVDGLAVSCGDLKKGFGFIVQTKYGSRVIEVLL
jgi:hypothetical protein